MRASEGEMDVRVLRKLALRECVGPIRGVCACVAGDPGTQEKTEEDVAVM